MKGSKEYYNILRSWSNIVEEQKSAIDRFVQKVPEEPKEPEPEEQVVYTTLNTDT